MKRSITACLCADLNLPTESLKTQILEWMEGFCTDDVRLNVVESRESKVEGIQDRVRGFVKMAGMV